MKLISLNHRYDYGHDWYVQIMHTKRWALFQASVSWNDYASWPYFQIKSGNGSTLSIMFWAYRFGFDIGIIERTWNWDFAQESEDDTSHDESNDFIIDTSLDDCMPPWGHSDMEYLSKNRE